MKMKYLGFSLFIAGAMLFSGMGVAQADDLKISGHIDVLYFIADDFFDAVPPSTAPNAVEGQFTAKGEIDLEKTEGEVTLRLDLDFPSADETFGTTLGGVLNKNVAPGGSLVGTGTFSEHVEQAYFSWAVPAGQEFGATLKGGIFNSPIGYESQDAPDKQQITNGQLWSLVPSNLAGVHLSGSMGTVSASILFTDEWRDTANPLPTAEENSLGFTVGVDVSPALGISAGYLTSDDGLPDLTATAGTPEDGDIFDVVLSGKVPGLDLDLTYAVEWLTDENNTGLGFTGHLQHGKHGVTVRYDTVDCDPGSVYCGGPGAALTDPAQEPSTLTIAVSCDLADNLQARLEWNTLDTDLPATATTPDTFDSTLLQFVATF